MMENNRPLSTDRVITQNLVLTATQAETQTQVGSNAVRDLSTLINLVALYDQVFVLGRGAEFYNNTFHSDLLSYLISANIVRTQPLDQNDSAKIGEIAHGHLAFYLGQQSVEEFDDVLRFALSPKEALSGLTYVPDTVEDVRIGDSWLRTVPKDADILQMLRAKENISRGGTFLMRTFLYLAYSDFFKVPFTSDSARTTVVSTVLKKEDDFFRSKILKTLQKEFENYSSSSVDGPSQMVSPFAAVVFDRCNGNRSRLVKEIQRIRDELRPTRERLREIEWDSYWVNWTEHLKAKNKIKDVLSEIHEHFGSHPGLISWKRGISFAEEAGGIIESPTSPTAWVKTFLSLPAHVARRLISRRPIAEIHSLQQAIPGPRALDKTIHDLFGDVKSDI